MATPSFPRPEERAAETFFVNGPASNWVILRDGKEFTLIDGGYPGDIQAVLGGIRSLGLKPGNAAAMLVTHSHIDHTGAADYLENAGVPVLVAAPEVEAMKGTEKFQVAPMDIIKRSWRPRVMKWTLHVRAAGGLKSNSIASARTWSGNELAGLPGSPQALPTHGHSPGHTAYYLPAVRALITGDALVSGHGFSAFNGPQMLDPIFHHDLAGAYGALAQISAVDAALILPGHGPALELSAADAAARARS